MNNIISEAVKKRQNALSEYDSKRLLKEAGIPITREELAGSEKEAVRIAADIGFPVALKGSGYKITHKTEMGLVKLNILTEEALLNAYNEIMSKGAELEGVLIQEMIAGEREFILGLTRDPQFGPCVLFGLGGIYAEILNDVSLRIAPLSEIDAEEMLDEIKASKLLDEFRGSPPANRSILKRALIGIGNLGIEYNEISEIDINPVIIADGQPVAVDGLVVLSNKK